MPSSASARIITSSLPWLIASSPLNGSSNTTSRGPMHQRAEQLHGLRHALGQLADLAIDRVAEAVALEQVAPARAPFGQGQTTQRAHEGDRLVAFHRRIKPAFLGQVADQLGDFVRAIVAEDTRRTPSSGSMIPSSIRSVVVLPAPLGPRMP